MREKCYTSSNSADSSVNFIRGRNRLEISKGRVKILKAFVQSQSKYPISINVYFYCQNKAYNEVELAETM